MRGRGREGERGREEELRESGMEGKRYREGEGGGGGGQGGKDMEGGRVCVCWCGCKKGSEVLA